MIISTEEQLDQLSRKGVGVVKKNGDKKSSGNGKSFSARFGIGSSKHNANAVVTAANTAANATSMSSNSGAVLEDDESVEGSVASSGGSSMSPEGTAVEVAVRSRRRRRRGRDGDSDGANCTCM